MIAPMKEASYDDSRTTTNTTGKSGVSREREVKYVGDWRVLPCWHCHHRYWDSPRILGSSLVVMLQRWALLVLLSTLQVYGVLQTISINIHSYCSDIAFCQLIVIPLDQAIIHTWPGPWTPKTPRNTIFYFCQMNFWKQALGHSSSLLPVQERCNNELNPLYCLKHFLMSTHYTSPAL